MSKRNQLDLGRTKVRLREEPKILHVVPEFNGEPEHVSAVDCWCEPELDYRDTETGGKVWLHRRPQ